MSSITSVTALVAALPRVKVCSRVGKIVVVERWVVGTIDGGNKLRVTVTEEIEDDSIGGYYI